MKGFFDEIYQALVRADPKLASDRLLEKVRPSDHTVGVASDKVRVLCGIVTALVDSLGDYDARIDGSDINSPKSIQWQGQRALVRRKIETLCGMISILIHEDFPELVGVDYVDVRRGWLVVYSNLPKGSRDPFLGLLADSIILAAVSGVAQGESSLSERN
jgi:hypothetical protein